MKKVGVLGTGTMGAGIIQVLAQNGYEVVLRARRQTSVDKGIATVEKGLDRLIKKEKITEADKAEIMGRIHGSTDISIVKDADLIIEAATEDMEAKKALFAELDQLVGPDTILATNTSSLSITEIAAATGRPDKVVGMHFFNPVPAMKLVEIIKGLATSEETKNAVVELAEKLGKTPVEVAEAPGFVVNRILIPMINEGIGILADGVADAKGIDTAAHQGALQAGGRTLAILGNGINRIYPEENRPLFEEILRQGGALISQFPINLPGDRKTYPIRNRTIAGISLGTVVIEAPQISGALITAGMALEMNREVFAVPGRIDSPLSAGCHKLIKEGAKLCENIQDILNEFQIFTNLEQIDSQEDINKKKTSFSQKSPTSPPHNNHPSPKKKQHQQPANLSLFQSQLPLPIRETNFLPLKLSPEETLLMEILTCQPQHIDELIRLSSLPSQKVQATLCSLELKKQVLQLPGKLYQKNSR